MRPGSAPRKKSHDSTSFVTYNVAKGMIISINNFDYAE